MAVDLSLLLRRPVKVTALEEGCSDVLSRLLRIDNVVKVQMRSGRELDLTAPNVNELGNSDSSHVLTVQGSNAVADVFATMTREHEPEYYLTFSVGPVRTPESYVVALAAAIWVGLDHHVVIEAGFCFWTEAAELNPEGLLSRFMLPKPAESFAAGCRSIYAESSDAMRSSTGEG